MKPEKALIFEMSKPGRMTYSLPACDVPELDADSVIPERLLRSKPAELPEVYEADVIRHYTELSRRNFGVDKGFYPLGSCTKSKAGDYVIFKALEHVIIGISACPQDMNPLCGWNITDIKTEIIPG